MGGASLAAAAHTCLNWKQGGAAQIEPYAGAYNSAIGELTIVPRSWCNLE